MEKDDILISRISSLYTKKPHKSEAMMMKVVRSGRVELPLSAPEANVLSTGLRARIGIIPRRTGYLSNVSFF